MEAAWSWQREENTGAGKLQLLLPGSTLWSGERDRVQVFPTPLVGVAEAGETGSEAGEEQGSGSVGLSVLAGEEGNPEPLAKPAAILLAERRLQMARGKG